MEQTNASPYPAPSNTTGHPTQQGQLDFSTLSPQDSQFLVACTQERQAIEEFMQNRVSIEFYIRNKELIESLRSNSGAYEEMVTNGVAFQEYFTHKNEFEIFRAQRNSQTPPQQGETGEKESLTRSTMTARHNMPSTSTNSNENSLREVENMEDDGFQFQGSQKRQERQRANFTYHQQKITQATQRTPRHTVVLKPTCKERVDNFTGRDIVGAMEKAGIQNKDDFSVHRNQKSNTIAITTKNPLLTNKLLNINQIVKGEQSYEMKPYMAVSNDQIRGVIYLSGHDVQETPETLMESLDCRTHTIVAARPIGRSGRTILITFDGKSIPKHVRFLCEIFRVTDYRPRPLVCYSCHEIGHKSDVCPSGIKRCDRCGHTHDSESGCELQPKCINCGGPHIATSNDCPKRKIPPKRLPAQTLQGKRPLFNMTKMDLAPPGSNSSQSWTNPPPQGAWATPRNVNPYVPPMVFGKVSDVTSSTVQNLQISPATNCGNSNWQEQHNHTSCEQRLTAMEQRMDRVEKSLKNISQTLRDILKRLND